MFFIQQSGYSKAVLNANARNKNNLYTCRHNADTESVKYYHTVNLALKNDITSRQGMMRYIHSG